MNRPETDVDVSTRDLLWHLPELLAGPEPVLERPAVKRTLRHDPEARLAIVAVAEMARTLEGRARPPILPGRVTGLTQSVKDAVRSFRTELSRLLFDCGLVSFNEGTLDRAAYSSQLLPVDAPAPGARRDAVRALARALDVDPDTAAGAEAVAALESISGSPLELARRQWTACDELVPGVDYVRFNLRLAEEELGRRREVGFWTELAEETASWTTKSGALLCSAHAAAEGRDSRTALELALSASRFHAESVINAYYRMLYGLSTGEERDALDGRMRLEETVADRRPLIDFVERQIRADDEKWAALRRERAPLIHESTRAAPAWLSEAIERCLS